MKIIYIKKIEKKVSKDVERKTNQNDLVIKVGI